MYSGSCIKENVHIYKVQRIIHVVYQTSLLGVHMKIHDPLQYTLYGAESLENVTCTRQNSQFYWTESWQLLHPYATKPRWWRSGLECLPRKQKVGCSNPSRYRPKPLIQAVTAPVPKLGIRCECHGYSKMTIINGCPVSKKVWHAKEPSLFNGHKIQHRSKSAALHRKW